MTDGYRVAVVRELNQLLPEANRRGDHRLSRAMRLAAQLLLEPPVPAGERQGQGCAGCGTPIAQPEKGGLRRWCSDACRTRTRRR